MTIIANWKSHKNSDEARVFLEKLSDFLYDNPQEKNKIILAPSFHLLKQLRDTIAANNMSISISAQNISMYEEGAYTGEISAAQISDLAEYAIIGHSERRRFFAEDEEVIHKKILQAKKENLKVILCLQNEHEKVEDVEYIAFEPPSAIGSGHPDDPSHIAKVFKTLKQNASKAKLLYGGSVTPENVNTFTEIPDLEGFLIGSASLDPDKFTQIITKC